MICRNYISIMLDLLRAYPLSRWQTIVIITQATVVWLTIGLHKLTGLLLDATIKSITNNYQEFAK